MNKPVDQRRSCDRVEYLVYRRNFKKDCRKSFHQTCPYDTQFCKKMSSQALPLDSPKISRQQEEEEKVNP